MREDEEQVTSITQALGNPECLLRHRLKDMNNVRLDLQNFSSEQA